jgi:hypothetical protein
MLNLTCDIVCVFMSILLYSTPSKHIIRPIWMYSTSKYIKIYIPND